MKPKTLALMIVAVGCGLAASFMTSRYLANAQAAPQQEQIPEVAVLVAKKSLVAYTRLTDATQFDVKMVRKTDVPSDVVGEFEKIKGRTLRNALAQGKQLSENDLLEPGQTLITHKLKAGERAIAVKVTADSSAGGFIVPGCRVDVLATARRKADGGEEPFTKTILQNVEVLAVGVDMTLPDGTIQKQVDRMVLRLTLEQCEELKVFSDNGQVSLVPRRDDDDKIVSTDGAGTNGRSKINRAGDNSDTTNGPTPTATLTAPTVPTAPAPTTVVKEEAPKAKPKQKQQTLTIIQNNEIKTVNVTKPVEEETDAKEKKETEK